MQTKTIKLSGHNFSEIPKLLPDCWWLVRDRVKTASNRKGREIYILSHKTVHGMDARFVELSDILFVRGDEVGVLSLDLEFLIKDI